jgi:NitT/TauT family transport system substrate-binding protein
MIDLRQAVWPLLLVLVACTSAGPSAAPTSAPAGAAQPTAAAAAKPATSGSPAAGAASSPGAAAAASPAAAPASKPTGNLRTVKVGTIPVIGMAPFIIGQQKGYFEQEGLALEFVNFQSGAEMVAPLSTGQLDAAVNVAPNAGLVNAIARGLAVKIVADNGSIQARRNVGSFIIRKDLQTGSDFADLSTLTRPVHAAVAAEGILPHALVLLTLQKAGVPTSQVDMTFLGLPDMNVAFANSRLDFGASGEPLITIGEQQGQVARWKPMNDVFPGMLYSVMLYGPNLLDKDKDLATRLMHVYLKGARDFEDAVSKNRDRATIVNMLVGPLRMTPDLFDQLQEKGGMVYIDPDGRGDPATLKPVVDFWAQGGTISQPVDPTTLVDFSAVDAALKDLGPYQR